ncbi:MAG TPA: alpha/beta fold hydrolase [Thermodesulfobacteriota bacterium]|nr:alpha/beta fold hydrolase [Thermodesulfobacteriota bacterium]
MNHENEDFEGLTRRGFLYTSGMGMAGMTLIGVPRLVHGAEEQPKMAPMTSGMFEYFPGNFVWNLGVMIAIDLGGAMGEIEEACRPLKEASKRNDDAAQREWCASWRKVGERIEALAMAHEKTGQYLSAGRKYIRAGIYFLVAERMLPHRDPQKEVVYQQGLAAFKKGYPLRKEPVEYVEVPFEGKSMPALFVKAPVKGPAPCMIHFDGFDFLKEFIYHMTTADEFYRRGISLLIVDHPGVGEALRLRNMYGRYDTEVPAAACLDYLEKRPDVDSKRIGIIGVSLGGYYAPRAAAFEKRFKCCVAWGGAWDFGARVSARLSRPGGALSVPDFVDQLLWVYGKKTVEEAVSVTNKMTLKGVADKITCPLLILHGENDRLVPLSEAQKLFAEAVNSPGKKLKVFTLAEGGSEHCQVDNNAMALDDMADWVAEVLGGDPKGV